MSTDHNARAARPLSYCPPTDLAGGACLTLGECWGHECVGFADCGCARCRHKRRTTTDRHPEHDPRQASYCGVCRTQAAAVRWRPIAAVR
jgi:hypothetical protein